MRLLLDTNIICDFLGVNKGFSEAAGKIIQLSIDNEAIELVSASAMTDIYHVLRRETKDVKKTVSQLQRLRSLIGILPVTEEDIDIALSRGWKDFEDAVQYTVAESNHIDYKSC